jgi:hypothetical protein
LNFFQFSQGWQKISDYHKGAEQISLVTHLSVTIFRMGTKLFSVTTKRGLSYVFGKLLSKDIERFSKNMWHGPFFWPL